MPDLAAWWVVEERAARVAEVVERVRDWEAANLRICGISTGYIGMKNIRCHETTNPRDQKDQRVRRFDIYCSAGC